MEGGYGATLLLAKVFDDLRDRWGTARKPRNFPENTAFIACVAIMALRML